MFALLSRKCILSYVVKKLPFEVGINTYIFEHLKIAVKKIKDELDRYCSTIFDEIALNASLQYSENPDKVIGFKDLGDKHHALDFADKAIVLMIRG